MNDTDKLRLPATWLAMHQATVATGFTMASEPLTGALLRALAASKPGGALLELGTGTGLATAWLLDGMDATARLVTVDHDSGLQALARQYLEHDPRVLFHTVDGGDFILAQYAAGARFDFIFADTWPGKYTHLDETLALLKPGGFYVVDDMLPQPNWPADHAPKVAALFALLAQRRELHVAQLHWASGLVIATKHSEA